MPYAAELFIPAEYEKVSDRERYGTDITALKPAWQQKVEEIFKQATLTEIPTVKEISSGLLGKEGKHTKYLDEILAEMQVLQRTHPGAEW